MESKSGIMTSRRRGYVDKLPSMSRFVKAIKACYSFEQNANL